MRAQVSEKSTRLFIRFREGVQLSDFFIRPGRRGEMSGQHFRLTHGLLHNCRSQKQMLGKE